LARPGQASDHGQRPPRDRDRYVLEVVLPCARDDKLVHITQSREGNRRSPGSNFAISRGLYRRNSATFGRGRARGPYLITYSVIDNAGYVAVIAPAEIGVPPGTCAIWPPVQ